MAWLFVEYDIARNSQVLRWKFSIPRATWYSVNSQATVVRPEFSLFVDLRESLP